MILDGYDEVAAPAAREQLRDLIRDFRVIADDQGADVLLVATTRPQGYGNEFAAEGFEPLHLRELTPAEAVEYARRLADVRLMDDPEMKLAVHRRVKIASADEATRRLMRSPLQVTIMSLLLEGRERVPTSRYALFDAYYETIYQREVAKGGHIGRLLELHRSDIDFLHAEVGLSLQCQVASDGVADPSITRSDLLKLASERLNSEGHPPEQALSLASDLVAAATERLVLLVPTDMYGVGFEIRSLQEFMASRAISNGPEELLLERLESILPSARWRNTWLLAAGRVFKDRQHLRGALVATLQQTDAGDAIHRAVSPGSILAVELLEDDVAGGAPVYRRMLVDHCLKLLQAPPGKEMLRLAPSLHRIAEQDALVRVEILKAVEAALTVGGYGRLSAYVLLREWNKFTGVVPARSRQLLHAANAELPDLHRFVLRAYLESLEGPCPGVDAVVVDRMVASTILTNWLMEDGEGSSSGFESLLKELAAVPVTRYALGAETAVLATGGALLRHDTVSTLTRDVVLSNLLARFISDFDSTNWPVHALIHNEVSRWVAGLGRALPVDC